MTDNEWLAELPVRQFIAAATWRGFIRFVNIRPEQKTPQGWVCDTCGERVTTARQERHARGHR